MKCSPHKFAQDNDNYRTVVRNDIRSWLSSLSPVSGGGSSGSGHARKDSFSSRGGAGTPPSGSSTTPTGGAIGTSGPGPTTAHPTAPEFLIVLVNPPAGAARDLTGAGANTGAATGKAAGMGRFYNIKGSVVDKLRADFNSGKRERWVFFSKLRRCKGKAKATDRRFFVVCLRGHYRIVGRQLDQLSGPQSSSASAFALAGNDDKRSAVCTRVCAPRRERSASDMATLGDTYCQSRSLLCTSCRTRTPCAGD